MSVGASLNNVPQTYGNGEILVKGAFSDVSSAAVVVHGKGFTVARTASTGCYLVTLTAGVKAVLASSADIVGPASTGVATYTHPGTAVMGELQSTGNTFYIYVYSTTPTQQWLTTGTICEFLLVTSISALNT